MKELTKAEEQVMQVLWSLGKGFLKDIVDQYDDPKPAYTTVSTVVNVLVKKEMIGFETYGKSRQYHPTISQEEYSKFTFNKMMKSFFNDSPRQFASFFTKQSDMSIEELKELQNLIDQQIQKKEG